MSIEIVRPIRRQSSGAVAAGEAGLVAAAREAVARARASGSFLIVRDTARRIAAGMAPALRDETEDAVARLVIEECARQGVAMLGDAREAVERLRLDGEGSVIAL